MMTGVSRRALTTTGGSHEQSKHHQGSSRGGRAGNGRRGGRHRRRGRGSEWIEHGDWHHPDPVDAEHDHSVHPVQNDPGAEHDDALRSPLPAHGLGVELGLELGIRIGIEPR
jgi:hypothetical protein